MTIDDWFRIIEEELPAWDTRLAFADWLEDNNESILAKGQRWIVLKRRVPYVSYRHNEQYPEEPMFVCWGSPCIHKDTRKTYGQHLLPQQLFDEMQSKAPYSQLLRFYWVYFKTLRQGEEELARALDVVAQIRSRSSTGRAAR